MGNKLEKDTTLTETTQRDRLALWVNSIGGNHKVEEATGVSAAAISNYLLGKSKSLHMNAISAFMEHTRLNISWYLFGEGEMELPELDEGHPSHLVIPRGILEKLASVEAEVAKIKREILNYNAIHTQ